MDRGGEGVELWVEGRKWLCGEMGMEGGEEEWGFGNGEGGREVGVMV